MPLITTYATTSDLKLRLSIDPADTSWDAVLGEVLSAASTAVDNYCRRHFGKDDAPVTRTYWANNLLYLGIDDVATSSAFSLNHNGGAWTLGTDYSLGPHNADVRGRPWQRVESLGRLFIPYPLGPLGLVTISATWGWPSVPAPVFEATLLQAGRLFKRKDSAFGVIGSPELGGGVTRLTARLDADVQVLLSEYRRLRWQPT